MKQFRLLLTILTLLAVGSMNTWAETCTISGTTSGSVNNVLSWSTTKGSSSNAPIWSSNHYRFYYASSGSGGYMTITPQTGITITGITLKATSSNYTPTVKYNIDGGSDITGTWSSTTMSITGISAKKSFKFRNANTTSKQLRVSITVTYETAASCTTPTFTIADKTISLSEASTADYDMSTNLTINKGGSTGAITYSCNDENVVIDGNTFYTSDAGTYTINATMAADATYCEAPTSFTITVSDDTPVITVTYDANGGTVSPTSDSYKDTPLTLPTPTIDGCYTFDGWYTAKTGGTKVESPYTPTTNTTLYAHWVESTATYMAIVTQPDVATNCKVKISKDGTTGVEDGYDDIVCGTTIYLLGTPSKGYKGLTYTAKDDNKNNVPITQDGLKDASFTMPASNVDITATPVPCDAMDAPEVSYTSTANSLTFSWKTVAGATQYNLYLYYNTDGTSHTNDDMANTTECSYTFSDLEVGHTYAYIVQAQSAIGTCFTETQGTATVVKPYTITWSVNGKTTTTTQVVEGDAIGTLPADPSAPSGCSDKVFVGWSITNIGATPTNDKPEFITANTIPTGNTTYYAVFATKANTSGSQDIVFNVGDIAAENNWNSGTQYSSYTIAPITITYSGGVNDGKYYSSDDSWRSYKGGSVVVSGGTISEVISFPEKTFTKQTDGTWKYSGTETVKFTKFTIKTTAAGSSYTDYITECIDCTAPAEALALTLSQETANLGQDGNAVVTFNTTGGNGTAVTYAVTPTTGATLSGTTITFTQEGTYTLTASQTYTTTGGTTYCGGTDSKTITIAPAEYTLSLYDRGSKTTYGNYYAGAAVQQPADPTGVCTEPINYVFDGWATAEVAEGSTTYTKVSFPYTIPKANTTLYAVYKYEGNIISDTRFRRGTLDDLVDGQKVVIVEQDAKKALNSKTYQSYYLTATDVTINNDLINVTNDALIWETRKDGDKYSFLQNSRYLNITKSSTYYNLTVTSTKDSWSIAAFGTGYSLQNTTYTGYYVVYNSKYSEYTADDAAYALQFYVPDFVAEYTTSPSCSPFIEGTDDIMVTSANGIWVEAVEPLNITATNLDKNADGANVTISAQSLTDGFTLKTQGTNGSGSKTVTLETGYSNSTYNANLTVVYTPSADNIIEEGKIALRVYRTSGTTTYATDTIVVRGRSLPAEFVLAAKTADGWVALPADLGTSSSDAVKYPYSITVDDDAAPTKATLAPRSALYAAAMRSTVNAIPTGLRFTAGGKYLQGSTSTTTTNVLLSATNSEQMQTWELHSSDLTNYFVRLQAAETGRYLSYNATQGKIANYKQESRLRILPVEQTCVRYDAPNIDMHARTSTSVTFTWEAIAGVSDYEYTIDGGQTWQICNGIETHGTEVKWTLPNLTSDTQYTVSVRAKVANGETNCSAFDTETFTTTTCDDVPVDLWVSATANTATITWRAKAATATVRIYADEQGTTPVKTMENAATPCKIVGLEQNTHYYYQVLADGSCASAIANFWTESNEVSIVEWEKEAVIVDLNTEVTGADEVSILVENQHTHGTSNQNIADDLFFSKYYEATGSVKLVAIYNGTKDTLSLKDMTIKIGISSWTATQYSPTTNLSTFGKKKTGFIAPNEEIIIWTKGTSYDYSGNNGVNIVECIGDKMDASVMVETNTMIFSGKASIGLFRGTELIDIIGALDEEDDTKPLQGSCKPSWGDEENVWCGTGWNLEDPTQEIELSTNRCLLVRSNTVKSGKNAVTKNRGAFSTLTKEEWLGRQVSKTNDTGGNYKGSKSSCEGFAYVADFNYNDYYTTYDSIANLEIKGNHNEDGTYTIPVPKLDTMACTNLRLQLKKNGTIMATREEKVPIIVNQDADTKNTAFFGEKLTDEMCKTCDVIIRNKSQLSHTEGGKQQFRDMYVYTGSSLLIPAGPAMSLDKVRMFATNDSVSYAIINNGAGAAISVKEVSHVKRIDGRYWYPFSLPYDCNIADIDQLNGQPLGVYGMDWGIKYYDGQRRQKDGNSETTFGEVSKYWTMMPENGLLKAYTGYIIGLFVPAADEPLMKSVHFPPATGSAYTESTDSKRTTVTNWADNLTADKRHHGWNFVGSPYISLFGAAEGEGLYNTSLKMGYTDRQGEQQDMEHIYVSIPDGGNKNTYTQSLAEGVTLHPFTAYFVQAVDPNPTDGQSNTLPLTYSKTQRLLQAPQRLQQTEQDILVELTLANGSTADNAGLWVGNSHTNEYEIGRDLTKMYSADRKPQLYTVAPYGKMAYQALPDAQAHAVPLGIYVPAKGDYTLSLNRAVSRVNEAQSVCLLYNGKVVADLLQAGYTLSATGKGLVDGYTLDIRRAPKVETDIVPVAGDAPYLIVRDGILTVANLPAEAMVQVYDVLGRICFSAPAGAQTVDVVAPQTGVYTVVVTTGDQPYILKTLLH